jgi:hypothetical protein
MRQLILLGFFLLVLAPSIFPQDQKVIRWSDPSLPKDCCSNWFRDGHLMTGYTDPKLEYVVSIRFDFDKKYMVAWVGIVNKSDKQFNVDPATFHFVVTDPQNKELTYVPTDEVAKDVEKRGKLLGVLTAFAAGMSTQTSTVQTNGNITLTDGKSVTRGTYDGTSTVTAPNAQVQEQIARQNAERQANNDSKAAGIKYFALKLNTLFKGDLTTGLVFFKNADHLNGAILSFVIDGVRYEVPFGSARPK